MWTSFQIARFQNGTTEAAHNHLVKHQMKWINSDHQGIGVL